MKIIGHDAGGIERRKTVASTAFVRLEKRG